MHRCIMTISHAKEPLPDYMENIDDSSEDIPSKGCGQTSSCVKQISLISVVSASARPYATMSARSVCFCPFREVSLETSACRRQLLGEGYVGARRAVLENLERWQEARQYWDGVAETFDDEPDHGLCDPLIRAAWSKVIGKWLPSSPVSILDIGCGTGSISLILAELAHKVVGIDLSGAMIAQAVNKAKAARLPVTFEVMDASAPQLPRGNFSVIVCRHVLCMMPDPKEALQRWSELMVPRGRIILIEGFWKTSGGLYSEQLIRALPSNPSGVTVEDFGENALLWGGEVDDERYIVTAVYLPQR